MISNNNNINNSINEAADYLFYKIGSNPIPADTQNKTINISWKEYQNKAVPIAVHESRKKKGEFKNGLAVMTGKIRKGKNEGKYLIGIDCDNKKAIEEICKSLGFKNIIELSHWTWVEQHKDDLNKAHIFILSTKSFKNKSSSAINSEIAKKIDRNEIPAIELKCEKHVMFCSPSIHKDGYPYEILDCKQPALYDEFENHLDNIFKKYGMSYLQTNSQVDGSNNIPITELFKQETKIYQGNNRHEALMRVMESLLIRNHTIMNEEEIKQLARTWNQNHCVPPLEDKQFERQWICAIKFANTKNQEQKEKTEPGFKKFLNGSNENESQISMVSVSDALRTNSGILKTQGIVTSRTNIYKMKYEISLECISCGYSTSYLLKIPISSTKTKQDDCPACEKKRGLFETFASYLNAVTIGLQDIETFNEIERLTVVLFEEDTKNINLGEKVTITGRIEIISESSNKKPHSVLYANSIKYESKEEIVLTTKDKDAIERFTKLVGEDKILDKLVYMFDRSIIGYDSIKKGLLLSAVSSSATDMINSNYNNYNNSSYRRQRIHSLIIGPPGLAKTKLIKRATELVPNSRYESGQSSTGKGLTAVIAKEDERDVLRIGAVASAKGAICSINELGRMSPEDQGHLLDVMEEGEFTKNAYAINARILAPTTIIASANPIKNSRWNDDKKIDLGEIPALLPIIDRFDQKFVVRDTTDEKKNRKYAYTKSKLETNAIPDYINYLKRHIAYAKRFNPRLTSEAEVMLNEIFIEIKKKNFGTNRVLDTLFRISKAISKLKLKNVIDVEDAKETIEFCNVMLLEFESVVKVPENPRDVTYSECVRILKDLSKFGGISLEELFKKACDINDQIKGYLGDKPLRMEVNFKIRHIVEMLLNNRNIVKIGEKPIVLKWINDNERNNSNSSADAA